MTRTNLSIACLFLALAAPLGCGSSVTDTQDAAASASASGSGGGGGAGAGGGGNGGGGGAGGAEPGGTYSAHNLFTHVPRFVIFKADPARDLCFRLYIEAGSSGLGFQATEPWVVARADVTEHASDCVLENGYPKPAPSAVSATSGAGTLTVKGDFPCETSIHGTISFDAQADWVPSVEPLDADALPVDGGCG